MFATLNTGARLPTLGFGLASDPVPPQEVKDAVLSAIQAGYRHFDTAALYNSEGPLGEALAEAFKTGLVAREELFVTSKLWCADTHPDDVLPAIKKSLSSLGLDYLDLYLIHWPARTRKGTDFANLTAEDFLPVDIKGTWQAMEKCVQLGLTKAIGVSNFSSKKVEGMLAYASIIPAVNQVEMHPKWQQQQLRAFCNKLNIHVSAWSPLGAPGQSWGSVNVLSDPVIKEIASYHGRSPAQVALRWGFEQGVSVIPKSYNKKRMLDNMQIFDWQLTEEDHVKISQLEQKKIVRGENFCFQTGHSSYKTVEELWDGEI